MEVIYGYYQEGMKLADLHIHCNVPPDDGLENLKNLLYAAQRARLSAIAITSHGTYQPSLMAKQIARDEGINNLDIIISAEIPVTYGRHLLAYYLDEYAEENLPLLSGKSPEKTILDLHSHHALAVAPHPFTHFTLSLGKRTLDRLVNSDNPEIYLDGLEICNRTLLELGHEGFCYRARHYQALHQDKIRGVTAGSDSHFFLPGGVLVAYKDNLRQELLSGQVAIIDLGCRENVSWGQKIRQGTNSLTMPLQKTFFNMFR